MEWETVSDPEYPETALEAYTSLVDGVLNLETKAVTALSLSKEPKTIAHIHDDVSGMVNNSGFGASMLYHYCDTTFDEIGLVTEARVSKSGYNTSEGSIGYAASEFGGDIQPLLSHEIKYVVESENLDSMRDVLGASMSNTDIRSPLNISKILHGINAEDGPTATSISRSYEMDRAHTNQLISKLELNSVVENYAPYASERTADYEVVKADTEDYTTVEDMGGLTTEIVDLLEEGNIVNYQNVSQHLDYADKNISKVLSGLSRQEILESVQRLKLTDKGEDALKFLDTTANFVDSLYNESDFPPEVIEAWEQYNSNPSEFNPKYTERAW